MRTYISPIGYNSTSVTRPVLSRGVDSGDEIVLIRPRAESDPSRAQEAMADVERMLTEIEPTVSLSIERITHDEFGTAVLECSDVLVAADSERIVNLGGGARDILLPFTVAAIGHADLIEAVLSFSDIDGKVREWSLPMLSGTLSAQARETLDQIADLGGSVSIPDLSESSDVAKSTVTRHVEQLDQRGAVETWREGKTKHARLTLTGQLLHRTAS